MTTLAEYMILYGADNRPPLLDKDLYDSWKSRMELYMQNREHKRMILESVEHGLLIWPMIKENRSCQGSMEKVQLLMQGTSLTKQERKCKLYDAFDKFAHIKGESLHQYYLRFTQQINDMNIYNMKLEQFQVNTKFLNSLPPELSELTTPSEGDKQLPSRGELTIRLHEKALNDALVVPTDRLEFEKCKMRFNTDIKPKEATFQVAIISIHNSSIRFTINKEKVSLDVEIFREILQSCPKIPRQKFEDLPLEHDILFIIRDLRHSGDIIYLTDVSADYLHQPWRAFFTIINKYLSGKENGIDKIRLSCAQILWGPVYFKKERDVLAHCLR
uniref:Integrase, catalytic region, zinc finger, CCHC-type, peptidase aspartic, catalytic n=1 Tax=Tanacetum cinerariifolium TaxID=118510 RepID=A0A6L2JAN4_TANCI|nr:hypothetical protein [Tanacetum cinerariifolium]